MKLIVKQLKGGECEVEVLPSTTVLQIKGQVAEKLSISVNEQKLLFLGRTLNDEHRVETYSTMKDGSKLNLVIKKPEGLYDVVLKALKQMGMSDVEAKNSSKNFVQAIEDNFKKLSWDDIDRLIADCIQEEEDSDKTLTPVTTQAGPEIKVDTDSKADKNM